MTINITPAIVWKAVLIGVLVYILFLVRDLILVVLAGIVVASAIEPFTAWFAKYRIRRLPAVILIYLLLAAAFLSIFYFFVPELIRDATFFFSSVPEVVDNLKIWNPLSESQKLVKGLSSLSLREIFSQSSDFLSDQSAGLLRLVSAIFGGALSFVLVVVLSFYLAVQENGIVTFLRIVTPLRHERYVIGLWNRSQIKIGKWLQGQIILGMVVGVLVYLGLTILGIRNALVFAVLAMIFELIPLFGPILAAIPPILVGFADGGLTQGLLVVGLYLVIQQFENHLIYPLVVKKIVGVPPILVILALIVGAKLGGFLGLVLSVPIAAVIMEYIGDVERSKMERQSV